MASQCKTRPSEIKSKWEWKRRRNSRSRIVTIQVSKIFIGHILANWILRHFARQLRKVWYRLLGTHMRRLIGLGPTRCCKVTRWFQITHMSDLIKSECRGSSLTMPHTLKTRINIIKVKRRIGVLWEDKMHTWRRTKLTTEARPRGPASNHTTAGEPDPGHHKTTSNQTRPIERSILHLGE